MGGTQMKSTINAFLTLFVFLFLFQATETRSEQEKDSTAYIEVNMNDAKALFEKGAVFIDTRSESEYLQGHIEGAILMVEEYLDKDIIKIIYQNLQINIQGACGCQDPLRRRSFVKIDCIVYGSETDDALKLKTAERLLEEGFRNVYIMQQGFDAWRKEGYSTETQN